MAESFAESITAFKAWIMSRPGGYVHPDVVFKQGPFGSAVHTKADLPSGVTIFSCPFALAITPLIARDTLKSLHVVEEAGGCAWSERQWICSYIVLHWILANSLPECLQHAAYLAILPEPKSLRTPLNFTPAELEAFKGTNLYGATLDREQLWREEWVKCRSAFARRDASWEADYTWDRYLTAATYLTSRAFPSTLLSSTPSRQPTPDHPSHPVLLPGVDALNHARGQAVSWIVDGSSDAFASASIPELAISLVLHKPSSKGQELFNNYGAKPNAELILGYGFSLTDNPDDTIVLQIGGAGIGTRTKWEVGRKCRGMEGLWAELVGLMGSEGADGGGDEGERCEYEVDLDAAGMLGEMVSALLERLPKSMETGEMRLEVQRMWTDYVEGQRDILQSIMDFVAEREARAVEAARKLGIEIVLVDED